MQANILTSQEVSDLTLLEKIATRDKSALEVFYKRHIQSVYAFVVRRLGDLAQADEIANDTLLQVWHSAQSFAGQSSVKTWLLGIAKNKTLDAQRKQGKLAAREHEATDEEQAAWIDTQPDAYAKLLGKQKISHLEHCFAELSAGQKTCIQLSFVEGMTLDEISTVMEIPSNTVATRIHHAKRLLRTCLECVFGKGGV